MVYSNAPTTYYSTLHDSITSLCKTILPLGFKKRCRLVSAEHRLWKLQSDNLKWQQDTFHQMLKLMGLHQEDILPEAEVSAFRTHLLDSLIACPPPQQDHPLILRDKLVFLQELLYAKCISEGEYHASKRPLLQRLGAQGGGDIEGKEVILAGSKDMKQNSEEEWSVIDLKDEQCLMNKEDSNSKKNAKQARKQIKGASSIFSFGSSYKPGKNSMEKSIFDSPSLHMHSAHSKIPPSTLYAKNELRHSKENPLWNGPEKSKRKPFRILFHREKREEHGGGEEEGKGGKSAKKQWEIDGFKKGKRSDSDDETAPLSLNERSDSEAYLASYQPFTKASDEGLMLMKNKLHSDGSPSHFSIGDKDKIKKEVSRIQTELRGLKFSNDHMEASSTKLSENKAQLKNHFPKSLCDRYGGVVLDVVKKESKDHVGVMENMRKDAEEKHENSMGWTTFEDDENLHPNHFVHKDNSLRSSSINPFSDGYA
ncbi:hypothetical protein SESBI_03810 [Sesbania bispinosa]|nr:hypothetical protein SESBI_03810 [Sesbania bispinosa]